MTKPKTQMNDGVSATELAQAIALAISQTRPVEKKTTATRVKHTPWTPKDGSPKLKLRRKAYQHSIPVNEKRLTNEQVALFNKLRPGQYCDNWVTVSKRNDKAINITYPVKTAAQRLKLINSYGIRSLDELLQRCVTEASQPKPVEVDQD